MNAEPVLQENGETERHYNDAPPDRPKEGPFLDDAGRLRYREFIEFALDGYLVTDRAGIIREANHAAAVILQCRKEFLLDKPLAFFVTPGERKAFYSRMLDAIHSGGAIVDSLVRLNPRGAEPIDVFVTVAAFSQEGVPLGLRWLLRDVTSLQRAKYALEVEKAFSEALAQTAATAIVVVDGEGKLLRTNPHLSVLSGYSPGELRGREWTTALVAAEDQPRAHEMIKALSLGFPREGVFGLPTRDGSRRTVAWTGRWLATNRTPMATILLTGQDVTALQEAQKKAVQAERLAAIGQMVAGLAHESRNALQRSQACLELLALEVGDRPTAVDLVGRIQKAQDQLHRLFEEVRGFAAPLRLESELCDLAETWREAWMELAAVRKGRNAELKEQTGDMDLRCVASPFHLKQVFRNVLDNSLSAAADPVRIVIHCSPAAIDGKPAVRIAVRDNGPGFAPEPRQRAFEPFVSGKVRGTGLGLAICKRIVEAHGGRIALGKDDETGAEVLVTLPLRRA